MDQRNTIEFQVSILQNKSILWKKEGLINEVKVFCFQLLPNYKKGEKINRKYARTSAAKLGQKSKFHTWQARFFTEILNTIWHLFDRLPCVVNSELFKKNYLWAFY